MTFWKDSLASWILANPECSRSVTLWDRNSPKFPRVRYKTADVKGKVVVIQLEGKGHWVKPIDWVKLHTLSLWERLHDDSTRLLSILERNEMLNHLSKLLPTLDIVSRDELCKVKLQREDLVAQLVSLTKKYNDLVGAFEKSKSRSEKLEQRLKHFHSVIRDNAGALVPKAIKELVK